VHKHQYQSLTPPTTHHCSIHEAQRRSPFTKRLSFLLTSLSALHTETKQREIALDRKYLQKSFKSYLQFNEIRGSLTHKSKKMWKAVLKQASSMTSQKTLEKAFEEANKAVSIRVQAERKAQLDFSVWA
jgi:hypothetical protein